MVSPIKVLISLIVTTASLTPYMFGCYARECGIYNDENTLRYIGDNSNGKDHCQIDIQNFGHPSKLVWDTFNVDGAMPRCLGAYVQVFVGCDKRNFIAEFCSRNLLGLPHDIFSSDGCIRIEYSRSNHHDGKIDAFSATFTKWQPLTNISYGNIICSKVDNVIRGPITNRYSNDHTCKWSIKNNDLNHYIKLNFMNVLNVKCNNYVIVVTGVKSRKYPPNEILLHECFNSPKVLDTKYSELQVEVKEKTDDSQEFQNVFMAGWVIYTLEEETIKKPEVRRSMSYSSIFTALLSAFILGSILCCVTMRKRRQRRINESNQNHTREVIDTHNNNLRITSIEVNAITSQGNDIDTQRDAPFPLSLIQHDDFHFMGLPNYTEANQNSQAPPPYPGPPITEMTRNDRDEPPPSYNLLT